MTKQINLADLIAESEEVFEAEQRGEVAPVTDATRITRPNRAKSVVFSVRLNPDEVARLEASAEASGIPASTLARGLILNGLTERDGDDLRSALERMERDLLAIKRRTLSA